MRIAHILSSFALGGQESVALELAGRQHRAGHAVLVVSLSGRGGQTEAALRAAGVETASVPKGPRLDPSLPLRLGAKLAAWKADVVHTHNPYALVYGAPAGRMAGARVLHTKHGVNPDPPRRRWLRRVAAKCVDAYVAVTPALADVAREMEECDAERLFVVPNGIDVERFAPDAGARQAVRAELSISPDAWVIGSVGRLAPEKDHRLLIRAASGLVQDGAHLVIVGDGSERADLADLAAEIGSGRIHLVGSHGDVERWLAAFDVFALSSRTEGLPLVLLEAMATCLPVVSTRVGGIADLVTPDTGLLVPAEDAPALGAALHELYSDPTRAASLGQAARDRVRQHYSAASMATAYEDLYTRITGHTSLLGEVHVP